MSSWVPLTLPRMDFWARASGPPTRTWKQRFLSHDPTLAHEVKAWFEQQWCDSSKIEDQDLAQAREISKRRQRSGGRGFTSLPTEEMASPGSHNRFSGLRLLAYLDGGASREAEDYFSKNAGKHYTDDELNDLGDEQPWYEWPLDDPEWPHPPGTVFADFSCSKRGGEFTFNGLWQVRHCPSIELKKTRITLLNPLPHFNGPFAFPERKAGVCPANPGNRGAARSSDRRLWVLHRREFPRLLEHGARRTAAAAGRPGG